MQAKAADDKQSQLRALEALLSHPDAVGERRARIEDEIRFMQSGLTMERQAAYEIEFQLGKNANFRTIHDLRLDIDGRVAQMDHLIITRFFEIWICESKAFAEGVRINDYAEWTRFHRGRELGMPSPIEQIKRHTLVLNDVAAKGLITLPRRLGIPLKPLIRGAVIVSNKARIMRPRQHVAAKIEGLTGVMKLEQLFDTIKDDIDHKGAEWAFRLVGTETIDRLARELVDLHVPATFDWPARFGLAPTVSPLAPVIELSPPPSTAQESTQCARCRERLSPKEIAWCDANASRFGGKRYCYKCQRTAPGLSQARGGATHRL